MPYVSAKYGSPSATDAPDTAKPVSAVDEQGQVWVFREDSQVGDWLDYLAKGGIIAPADVPVDQNINAAPTNLTGGPTIAEAFNVHN